MNRLIKLLLTLQFLACVPEKPVTDFSQTIRPNSGANTQFITDEDTPVLIKYSIEEKQDSIRPKLKMIQGPEHGTLQSCLDSKIELNCTYVPNANYYGEDTIRFVAVDGDFVSEEISELKIVINSVADAPLAPKSSLSETLPENSIHHFSLLEGKGIESSIINYSIIDQPKNGTLLNCPKMKDKISCSYRPNKDYIGEDSFTYKVTDSKGHESKDKVTVKLRVLNYPDIGADKKLRIPTPNTEVKFDINPISDSDSKLSDIQLYVAKNPMHGTLSHCFTKKGSLSCQYKSHPQFSGVDEFHYYAIDSDALKSKIGKVFFQVAVKEEAVGDIPKDEDVQELALKCDEAKEKDIIITRPYKVNFSGSPKGYTCDFNDNATDVHDAGQLNAALNGPRKNEKIRARLEQESKIILPQNATICDMKFIFPQQQAMKYDDEIFLTVNNYVVMASQDVSVNNGNQAFVNGLFVNSLGLVEYKWLGLNGLYDLPYIGGNRLPRYCLGIDQADPNIADKCHIPPTDEIGTFKLDIPSDEIIKLGILSKEGEIKANSEIKFGFISIGDNDRGDCETSPYQFDIEVKYIQLPSEENTTQEKP